MCGITGYIGHKEAYPIIINGLKRLEYRGYDSAGIMMYDGTEINLSKTKGKSICFRRNNRQQIQKEKKET